MAKEEWKKLGVPKYKEFNGKRYAFSYADITKADAKQDAADLRKKGYNARVVKWPGGYLVYRR